VHSALHIGWVRFHYAQVLGLVRDEYWDSELSAMGMEKRQGNFTLWDSELSAEKMKFLCSCF
jgi:hypothetical protein